MPIPFSRMFLIGLLVMCACAHQSSQGNNIPALGFQRLQPSVDAAAVARTIVLCRTTAAELLQALGPPSRDGLFHGARILSWITRSESPGRYLAILVNSRGVVADIYWDIPTEALWIPTDQCPRE